MLAPQFQLAELGYPIFPCAPGSKKPFYGTHGLNDATTDAEQIRSWTEQHSGCNWAIPAAKVPRNAVGKMPTSHCATATGR